MMGFGTDALLAVDDALTFPINEKDQSNFYALKADIYRMIGDFKQSNLYYKKSIYLNPCYTERYINYVVSLKDLKQLTKQGV